MLLNLSDVADVDTLIPGAPASVTRLADFTQQRHQGLAKFRPYGNRVGGSAAHVVDLPGSAIYTVDGLHHGLDEVVNIKQVAHLLAVTVDRQLPALERRASEVRHPALVLGAQLAAAIDAGHPKHDGG